MSGLALALPAAAFYLFSAFRQWLTVSGKQPANRGLVLAAAMAVSGSLLGCKV